MGKEVLRELHAADHELRLLVRNRHAPAAREAIARYAMEVCEGDILNLASLQPALRGVDAAVHLVGIIAEHGAQTFENVHVRGTENLIGTASVVGLKRFIHMSALGTRENAVSRYHRSKWAAEEAVRRSTLDWTILRPSVIYGPGDQFVSLFARLIQTSPFVPVLGEGRARLQPVAVGEVARCVAGALEEPRSIRQSFDVGGQQQLTLPQILETIMSVLGIKRRIVRIPLEWANAVAAVLEKFYPLVLKRPPPLNRDQLVMLQENNVGDCQWAAELFELKQAPFAEGIAAYLNVKRAK